MSYLEILSRPYFEAMNANLEVSIQSLRLEQANSWVQDLENTLWGYHSLTSLVPTLSGRVLTDPFGLGLRGRILTEATEDLYTSLTLAFGGFYKSGTHNLRSFVELALLAFYLGVNPVFGAKWFQGGERTPAFAKKIVPGVLALRNVERLSAVLDYKQEVIQLYDSLGASTHTRGLQQYFTELPSGWSIRNKFPGQFTPDLLRAWCEKCTESVRLVSILIVAKFPVGLQRLPLEEKFNSSNMPIEIEEPLTGILRKGDVDAVDRIFDHATLQSLRALCEADEDVLAIRAWIESLPPADQSAPA